jgi:hypothetical protein
MPKCGTCGKPLKNALALKIHVGRMHKNGAEPLDPAGLDVRSLAIDLLIALKRDVDRRLASIAERLKQVGMMGGKPGRKPGRQPKVQRAMAPVAKTAKVKKGMFNESASEMILGLLKGGKALSTTAINAAWKKAGRAGTASVTLSHMAKAGKVKREDLKGTRANNYRLA